MSTVDSINEAILGLKIEATQRGDSIDEIGEIQVGSDAAKAAWHLSQALELLSKEDEDDQSEPEESSVSTEAGEEGKVSEEAPEAEEDKAAGVEVDESSSFTGESVDAPPGTPEDTNASAAPPVFGTTDPSS